MKIIYFSYLYDIRGVSAGSANKAIGFIRALNEMGDEAKIYWRSVQPEDLTGATLKYRLRDRLKKSFSNYVHDFRRLAANRRYYKEELQILRSEKPDLLMLRNELYNFSALAAARRLGIPVVLEVDCPTAFEHRYLSGKDKVKLGTLPERIEQWNWRHSKAIIAISNILKDFLVQNGVEEQKITVIPNGADPQRFRPGCADASWINRYPLQNRVVIGWVGSLVGWSGLENLLCVSRQVLQQRPETVFLFVGGGKNKEIIEKTFDPADLNKRVFLTGTVGWDDVPAYVDLMDITIAPYPKLDFWYPSSMKIFEYLSAQKVVIASAVGQIAEIIQDGENGLLFDPDDQQQFLAKILSAVDDPVRRAKLAEQARRTVLEKYTWARHARTMKALFEQVLQRSGH
jgi:glycosyltransferase involved in cell wall biosynthesis